MVPNAKEEYTESDPKLKANVGWIKAAKIVQTTIMQDSQLLLMFHGAKAIT